MDNYFNGRGTFGFTCDVCGKEVNGCSIVNGMKFCAKCYQETFGKDNQQNEIQQLKQQLAEKDKEIEEKMMSFEKRCQEYYKSDEFKRDFAIQELEKVKELLLDEYKKYPIVYDKTNDIVAGALDRDKVNEIIDQQIKELKGE